jgi:hypothetical protein
MEYQHKLILVSAVLVVIALYLVFTMPAPPAGADNSQAEALLLKSAGFGKGLLNYTYAYSDVSDGYKTTYALIAAGETRYIEITNPLSTKKVYLLANDTIFCIKYPINESCVSVQNNSEMQNYIAFVESKFFNDSNILKAESSMDALVSRGYLHAEAGITDKTVGNAACSQVAYTIDYSNATVQDAALFGIGAQSPKVYNLTRCIDNSSGLAYETMLAYTDNSIRHSKSMVVSAFREGAPSMPQPPESSGDAIGVFRKEREQQVALATCHTDKQGEEREKCVADIALNLKRKDICELAGARRDRCLISIVPLTKDQTICTAVTAASYKDDCFIELAGAYKNSSYCANVLDASKLAACQEAAAPRVAQNETDDTGGESAPIDAPAGNESAGNATSKNDEVDALGLLNYIENYGKNTSNSSASGNMTGNSTE